MPQLVLKPWFMIFLFSWAVFLTIIPNKIMKYYYNNEPKMASTQKPGVEAWNWLWH
uniref:ATP synthase F0 subunit 8 n=1 Tax=Holopristis ocellifer TaxID=1828400 RepID=UPI0021D53618|nr:ATP synthase F0 subunit 8 [Hemigrammus ocellifer]UXD78996.1 ATP synthase F0 subunit 8 [Hemigrammus ocellifer]